LGYKICIIQTVNDMKISPIEIRKKEFEKAFRGYEKEEVDAFLQTLSKEWEKLQDENREAVKIIDEKEKELVRMRDVEASLYRTIKSAEDTSSNMIEQSNKTAELHIREAQMNAESLLNEARGRARALIEDAEMEIKTILDDLQIEAKNIEKEYKHIENQREYLIEEIKLYAKEVMDKVAKFETKTNLGEFEKKLKEIRNISNYNPMKNLEITNTEAIMEVNSYKKQPVMVQEEELKEQKKTDGSFFDSIV